MTEMRLLKTAQNFLKSINKPLQTKRYIKPQSAFSFAVFAFARVCRLDALIHIFLLNYKNSASTKRNAAFVIEILSYFLKALL